MLIVQVPTKTVTSRHTCAFHKKNPGKEYAGCTCSSSYSQIAKTFEEMTKEEREFVSRRGY